MSHHDRYLFTSESVSMGHPDKMADQISDGILDAILEQDPYGRVACESLLTTGLVCLAGEITTRAMIDYPTIVRQVVRDIGYTSSEMGFDATTCAVIVALGKAIEAAPLRDGDSICLGAWTKLTVRFA